MSDLSPPPAPQVQWGRGPSSRYPALAAVFRPTFQRIAAGAVAREIDRQLPFEQIGWLKALRFGALRLPESQGGYGASLEDLFELLTELAAADSNLTQILRAHFGAVENLLASESGSLRKTWFARLAQGDLFGGAFTERGVGKAGRFATTILPHSSGWVVDGIKYYSTGSLFADWIEVVGTGADEKVWVATVPTSAPGLTQDDDWHGFGQRLTGSGTSVYREVVILAEAAVPADGRFRYQAAFYQTVHLATLTGIARAAAVDATRLVAARTRTFTHAAARLPRQDPQVLEAVGRVHAAAYAAGAITARVAQGLQRAFEANEPELGDPANLAVEIEAAEAQVVVTDLVLTATTRLFEALAASATSKDLSLDRHWRNARTISSHNPTIYKARVVGDFAVNGTAPPYMWLPGEA